jgi:hypothetical protein
MRTTLEKKQKNRFCLLHKLYDLTGGVAERHLIDIREVGQELGMTADEALETFEYLKGEGLVKWMALGGQGTITHWGIKEVEDALSEKPTAHFPANIVILTNSPGASITTGTTHNTTFDQRGQTVTHQYNAAGNINVGAIHSREDFVAQLGLLKAELKKASDASLIDELTESRLKTLILEALAESKKSQPEKSSVVSYLNKAAEGISTISGVTELADGIKKCYEWASNYF